MGGLLPSAQHGHRRLLLPHVARAERGWRHGWPAGDILHSECHYPAHDDRRCREKGLLVQRRHEWKHAQEHRDGRRSDYVWRFAPYPVAGLLQGLYHWRTHVQGDLNDGSSRARLWIDNQMVIDQWSSLSTIA